MRIRFHLPTHIRLVDGEPPAGGSDGGGEDGQPKSFTQEQVDQIVEKRLAKERGKYKDYDELKDKATKFDEAQDAGKSELDRLKESNAALQKQIDDAAAERQHAEWVSEVAKAKDVPAGLLRGGTRKNSRSMRTSCMRHCIPHPKEPRSGTRRGPRRIRTTARTPRSSPTSANCSANNPHQPKGQPSWQ